MVAAIQDRLLDNSAVVHIDGHSYRVRAHGGDPPTYERGPPLRGTKIPAADYDTTPLTPHERHGESNYTIAQSNAR